MCAGAAQVFCRYQLSQIAAAPLLAKLAAGAAVIVVAGGTVEAVENGSLTGPAAARAEPVVRQAPNVGSPAQVHPFAGGVSAAVARATWLRAGPIRAHGLGNARALVPVAPQPPATEEPVAAPADDPAQGEIPAPVAPAVPPTAPVAPTTAPAAPTTAPAAPTSTEPPVSSADQSTLGSGSDDQTSEAASSSDAASDSEAEPGSGDDGAVPEGDGTFSIPDEGSGSSSSSDSGDEPGSGSGADSPVSDPGDGARGDGSDGGGD